MKLLTRNTDYAIRALGCIAGSERRSIDVNDLIKKLDMPRPFLRKILQTLTKKGFLKSFKGKGGGFSLGRDARSITILEIVESFQGPFVFNEHTFKGNICRNINACNLKRCIDRIQDYAAGELKNFKVIDLLKDARKRGK